VLSELHSDYYSLAVPLLDLKAGIGDASRTPRFDDRHVSRAADI
jgi:hypothetical protein